MRSYIFPYISSICLVIVVIQFSTILPCAPGRPVKVVFKHSNKVLLNIPKTKTMKDKFQDKNKTNINNTSKNNDVNKIQSIQRQVRGPMPPKGRLDIWTKEVRRIVFSVGPRYRGKL